MFFFVVLKYGFLMKLYGKSFLEILFENFVEGFDIIYDNQISWSSLLLILTNNYHFKINDKDKYNAIILKLRLQRLLCQIFLILSSLCILANTYQPKTFLYISIK